MHCCWLVVRRPAVATAATAAAVNILTTKLPLYACLGANQHVLSVLALSQCAGVILLSAASCFHTHLLL